MFDLNLAKKGTKYVKYANGGKVLALAYFEEANESNCIVTVNEGGWLVVHDKDGRNNHLMNDLVTKEPFRPKNGEIYWVKINSNSLPSLWECVRTDSVMLPYFVDPLNSKDCYRIDEVFEIDETPIPKPNFKTNEND